MKLTKRVFSLLILIFLLISITQFPVYISREDTNNLKPSLDPLAKIHPMLLEEEYYKSESPLIPILENASTILSFTKGARRVIVTVSGYKPDIAKYFTRIINVFGYGGLTLVYGFITKDSVLELAKEESVIYIAPDVKLSDYFEREKSLINKLALANINSSKVKPINVLEVNGVFKLADWLDIIEAPPVWYNYGIEGSDISIAIIDTGVDYASLGLGVEAIARDENGLPLIFDADQLGLTLTLVEAIPNATGYININPNEVLVFDPWDGSVFTLPLGFVYLDGQFLIFDISTWYVGGINSLLPFKFGLQIQFVFTPVGLAVYTVPVILASTNGEYYDVVYADLSTLWAHIGYMLGYFNTINADFNFTDEKPLMYGDEVSYLDWDLDGIRDFTIGTLAGYVYDVYGVITLLKRGVIPTYPNVNYTWHTWDAIAGIYPGLDPEGLYVTIAYDFWGHGTACANVAAGRGVVLPTGYEWRALYGVAPKAKIASGQALWFGNTIAALLFFSGFDPVTPKHTWSWWAGNWTWVYRGTPRVNITSNSYGFVAPHLAGFATGYDPWSLFYDYVTLKSGIINVIAAGNEGDGWGTISPPGASLYSITAGASTSYGYRTAFGYLPGSWDDIIAWSSRGPVNLGTPKPDVVAIGAYGWTVGYLWEGVGIGWFSATIFGGTSMAAPMTAGVAALVLEAFTLTNRDFTPDLVKVIIKSTTDNLLYDPLSQGAGRVNAFKAVSYVLNNDGFIAYSTSVSEKLGSQILNTLNAYTDEEFTLSEIRRKDTAIYFGEVYRGRVAWTKVTIEGPGVYSVKAVTLKLVSEEVFDGLINISNVLPVSFLFLGVFDEEFFDSDMVNIAFTFNYSFLDPYGRAGNYSNYLDLFLVVRYWVDLNNNSVITLNETAWLHSSYKISDTVTVTLSNASEKFEQVLRKLSAEMGIDYNTLTKLNRGVVITLHIPTNEWYGIPTDLMPYKLIIRKYNFEEWPVIRAPSKIRVFTRRTFTVMLLVPWDLSTGYYSGFLVIERDDGKKVLLPTAFSVAARIDYITHWLTLPDGAPQEDLYYNNYGLRGSFDWYGWYLTGDWRTLVVNVVDRNVKALIITITWPYKGSNLDMVFIGSQDVFIIDWQTLEITKRVTLNGLVVGGKLTWPVRAYRRWGWLPYFDAPMPGYIQVIVPVYGPGSYRIVIRNAPFAGYMFSEPYRIYITPVRIYGRKTLYVRPTVSTTYRMPILSTSLLLNESLIYPFIDGFNSTHYIPDLSAVGISLGSDVIHLRRIGIFYRDIARLPIATNSTPKDRYTIGWAIITPIPVFIVGMTYEGVNYPIAYSYYIPVLINLVVR